MDLSSELKDFLTSLRQSRAQTPPVNLSAPESPPMLSDSQDSLPLQAAPPQEDDNPLASNSEPHEALVDSSAISGAILANPTDPAPFIPFTRDRIEPGFIEQDPHPPEDSDSLAGAALQSAAAPGSLLAPQSIAPDGSFDPNSMPPTIPPTIPNRQMSPVSAPNSTPTPPPSESVSRQPISAAPAHPHLRQAPRT